MLTKNTARSLRLRLPRTMRKWVGSHNSRRRSVQQQRRQQQRSSSSSNTNTIVIAVATISDGGPILSRARQHKHFSPEKLRICQEMAADSRRSTDFPARDSDEPSGGRAEPTTNMDFDEGVNASYEWYLRGQRRRRSTNEFRTSGCHRYFLDISRSLVTGESRLSLQN